MKDYKDYEKRVEENCERNKIFLAYFKEWLIQKGLTSKTIHKHLDNVEFYINDFLNYYEVTKMEDGIYSIDEFLGDWFIRKCLWSSENSIKTTAASLKKFYQCMCEKEYVSEEAYEYFCDAIKQNMESYLEQMAAYENEPY